MKSPLISQSARLKTNKVCKQFCTSGCFMSWTIVYLGLNLKKFISSLGKGTVPAGGFVSRGVLARLLQSSFQLPFSHCCSQVHVIHSTFPSLSNTSVIFRNVYKCQQACKSPKDSAGTGRYGESWDYVTLEVKRRGRDRSLSSWSFLGTEEGSSGEPGTRWWPVIDCE